MRVAKLVVIILAVSLVFPWNTACAYGGGSGGGTSQPEDGSFSGGAVSWSKNPNGLDVMGSSIWHGRPDNLRKGPYQPSTAVEDAEQDLLDGFKRGEYTAEEVKENLTWAKKAGIHISNEAQKVLDGLSAPPGSSAGKSRTGSTPYKDFVIGGEFGLGYGDPTAYAFVNLAARTAQKGGGLSNKDALRALLILYLMNEFL